MMIFHAVWKHFMSCQSHLTLIGKMVLSFAIWVNHKTKFRQSLSSYNKKWLWTIDVWRDGCGSDLWCDHNPFLFRRTCVHVSQTADSKSACVGCANSKVRNDAIMQMKESTVINIIWTHSDMEPQQLQEIKEEN